MTNFRQIFENDWCGIENFLKEVLSPVFGDYEQGYDILTNDPEVRQKAENSNITEIRHAASFDFFGSELKVFDITVGDDKKLENNKVGIQAIVRQYINQFEGALIIFHHQNVENQEWRFSYVEKRANSKDSTSAKRYTYILGKEHPARTISERFNDLESKKNKGETILLSDLTNAFSVEALTKQFYQELFSWYTWACKLSTYPQGKGSSVKQTDKNNETNLIRLITRLMFVWFIKQKDLIPSWIFDEQELKEILSDFDSQNTEKGNYYNAVIQNLFFATLNKAIAERGFTDDDKAYLQYGIKTLYRDDNKKSFFKVSHEEIIRLFSSVPFLNGGLFECLDKLETSENGNNIQIYNDGFSREKDRRAFIPNALFFQKEKDGHEGIVHILNRYNFTVEENTPSDVQVALDPELLGKVFENLLGTYNPETSETARKDSGSFYTPREIVNFMVDESIKNYLENSIKISSEQFSQLFDDNTSEIKFNDNGKILNALTSIKVLDPACGSGAFPVGILQRLVSLIRKLDSSYDSKQSLYELKLHLIENCIFGSDIQTIAVQIAKLRFFITLICEQEKGNDAKNNYGFDPLPNLETKFVAANSLIEISKKEENMALQLFDNGVSQTREELKNIRAKHFSSQTAKEKMHYRTLDKECRERLAKLLEQDRLYDNEDAKQLASWNPYDQNAVADFFDANWMFGIEDGFDIVIGNPPYIQLQNNSGKLAKLYENQNYKAFAKTGDIYCLFYERGFNLLKDNAHLCFITSNKWMRAGYGEKLRDFFAKNANPKELIDFAGVKVFESATVDTNILLFQKAQNQKQTLACVTKNMKYDDLGNLSHFIQQNSSVCAFEGPASWVILSPIEQSIKRKIESAGVPLKDWDISINYGIKTGYNDAFIISGAKRAEILAECKTEEERRKTDELIRPVLRGRDIKRYGYEFADLYLIATFPSMHYNIEEYPAVKNYLLSFGIERLEQTGKEYIVNGEKIKARKKTNNKWFETQDSISYWDDFFKPKIVWGNLNLRAAYAVAPEGMFVNAPCPMIVPADEYLLRILNSKLADYYIRSLGVTRNGGYFEYKPMFIEKLPVPPKKGKSPFSEKDNESQIDQRVYELYGLSKEEIDFIERQ